MSDPNTDAGLVYAPPYDASSELDPASAEAISEASDDLKSLAYFQEMHARQTNRARAILLGTVFLMLVGNMVLTGQMRSDVMTNLDQARLDQAALSEMVQTRVIALESRIAALNGEILQLRVDAAKPTEEAVPEE